MLDNHLQNVDTGSSQWVGTPNMEFQWDFGGSKFRDNPKSSPKFLAHVKTWRRIRVRKSLCGQWINPSFICTINPMKSHWVSTNIPTKIRTKNLESSIPHPKIRKKAQFQGCPYHPHRVPTWPPSWRRARRPSRSLPGRRRGGPKDGAEAKWQLQGSMDPWKHWDFMGIFTSKLGMIW